MVDFYYSLFQNEQSRKDLLDNNYASSTIAIISGFVLVNFYFVNEIFNSTIISEFNKGVLFSILIISLLIFLIAVFYFIKAYNNWFLGFDYKSLPNISIIRREQASKKEYQEKFGDAISDTFSEAAASFQETNIKRFKFYFKCRQALIGLLINTCIYIGMYYIFYYIN